MPPLRVGPLRHTPAGEPAIDGVVYGSERLVGRLQGMQTSMDPRSDDELCALHVDVAAHVRARGWSGDAFGYQVMSAVRRCDSPLWTMDLDVYALGTDTRTPSPRTTER